MQPEEGTGYVPPPMGRGRSPLPSFRLPGMQPQPSRLIFCPAPGSAGPMITPLMSLDLTGAGAIHRMGVQGYPTMKRTHNGVALLPAEKIPRPTPATAALAEQYEQFLDNIKAKSHGGVVRPGE